MPPGGLDFNVADEEKFSPDKLRAVIERLYMSVLLNLMGSGKQIVRLRSWRETRRTSAFCVVRTSLRDSDHQQALTLYRRTSSLGLSTSLFRC